MQKSYYSLGMNKSHNLIKRSEYFVNKLILIIENIKSICYWDLILQKM